MSEVEEILYKGMPVKDSISKMNVGDVIPCRYTNYSSGEVGYISEIGKCNMDEIDPIPGEVNDGKFYFVKVDRDKLIADRNVQKLISWDKLNVAGIIDGIPNRKSIAFNGKNSYVRIPITNIKNKISGKIAIVVRAYKDDWMFDLADRKIYSCTQSGGFTLAYGGSSKTIGASMSLPNMPYVGVSIPITNEYRGWLTFKLSYDGTNVKLECIETGQSSTVRKAGSVGFSTESSYLLLGAEPGSGTSIESSYGLFNGKISSFKIWNVPNVDLSNEDDYINNLVCNIDPNNAVGNTIYDKGMAKANGTLNNCTFWNYGDILSVPNGGVEYSSGLVHNYNTTFPLEEHIIDSNENEYCTITSSGEFGGGCAWMVFNRTSTHDYDGWHSLNQSKPYIIVNFKDAMRIKGYRLTLRGHVSSTILQPPMSCDLYGSNDGDSFELVNSYAVQSRTVSAKNVCILDEEVEYKSYKFVFTSSSSGYTFISNLDFLGFDETKSNDTDKTWPSFNNDWDKYINNKNLIDSSMWNSNEISSITECITTPFDIYCDGKSMSYDKAMVILRGGKSNASMISRSCKTQNIGFRPVIKISGVSGIE